MYCRFNACFFYLGKMQFGELVPVEGAAIVPDKAFAGHRPDVLIQVLDQFFLGVYQVNEIIQVAGAAGPFHRRFHHLA